MDAIILAGGLGTRLSSVVHDIPKCMAPVAGRPFLYYLLRYLSHYPIGKVILSVGHLREHIFSWIDSCRQQFPFPIVYAVEESPLGTGGAIKLAMQQVEADEAVIINGDGTDEDLLKEAEIPSPFQEGALQTLAEKVESLLHKVKAEI